MNTLLSNLQIILSVRFSATSCRLWTRTARRWAFFMRKSLSSLFSRPSFSSTVTRMSASWAILVCSRVADMTWVLMCSEKPE